MFTLFCISLYTNQLFQISPAFTRLIPSGHTLFFKFHSYFCFCFCWSYFIIKDNNVYQMVRTSNIVMVRMTCMLQLLQIYKNSRLSNLNAKKTNSTAEECLLKAQCTSSTLYHQVAICCRIKKKIILSYVWQKTCRY